MGGGGGDDGDVGGGWVVVVKVIGWFLAIVCFLPVRVPSNPQYLCGSCVCEHDSIDVSQVCLWAAEMTSSIWAPKVGRLGS